MSYRTTRAVRFGGKRLGDRAPIAFAPGQERVRDELIALGAIEPEPDDDAVDAAPADRRSLIDRLSELSDGVVLVLTVDAAVQLGALVTFDLDDDRDIVAGVRLRGDLPGALVTDAPEAGAGEGVQLPGATDPSGVPLPPIAPPPADTPQAADAPAEPPAAPEQPAQPPAEAAPPKPAGRKPRKDS